MPRLGSGGLPGILAARRETTRCTRQNREPWRCPGLLSRGAPMTFPMLLASVVLLARFLWPGRSPTRRHARTAKQQAAEARQQASEARQQKKTAQEQENRAQQQASAPRPERRGPAR